MSDSPTDPAPRGPDLDDDEPAWVSMLVSAGGALGMNKMRLRWKLRRWVRRRREDGHRLVQKAVHVGYQHRVCGHCTAVNDRGDAACHRCGRPLAARPVELARRLGLWVPRGTMTTLLVASMLAVFAAMVFAPQHGTLFQLEAWTLAGRGANLPGVGDVGRDLTSLLVQDGLFPLLIGMFLTAMVGSLLERELGGALVIPVFLLTGAAGAAASDLLGRDGLGMGAAAGVCGLIGAGAIIGQRAGTRRGITYRNELLSLAVLVIGFGFFGSTDYRALLPAAALGVLLGGLLPRAAIAARPGLTRVIGGLGAAGLVAVAVVAIGQVQAVPVSLSPPDGELGAGLELPYEARYQPWSEDPGDPDDIVTQYIACEVVARRDPRAIAVFSEVASALATCAQLADQRAACVDIEATLATEPDPARREQWRPLLIADCKTVREIDAMRAR